MKARLILEDGSIYEGESLGYSGCVAGEVVFNTGMTGYQEILTDPSYYGQIVVMTYPLIGNYGMNPGWCQSFRPHVAGFVVSEACGSPSHWESAEGLHEYLAANSVVAMSGTDTRALTRRIRDRGTMKGVLAAEGWAGFEPAVATGLMNNIDLRDAVMRVTSGKEMRIPGNGPRVVVIDYGAKRRIIRMLADAGCELVVVPAWYTAPQVLALEPEGVVLSNGPGDPKDAAGQTKTAGSLLGKLPLFGICLGHQVLALAAGAETYKMKFGHRGSNHPVKDLRTGHAWITSQNHGYAVDPGTLDGTGLEMAQVNLTDGTVEGVAHPSEPVMSVQYHPEAGPGPHDSSSLFRQFVEMISPGAGRGSTPHARAS
ncbi:MAG: glutamine-hydrolyzing carbamoyl-phosphate synthase small subunit [Firmicutes bacterium]|nr:glutamine-hydrolyzing carbamoyl-phosphate synthase small subunit [Bacillota bacterium]